MVLATILFAAAFAWPTIEGSVLGMVRHARASASHRSMLPSANWLLLATVTDSSKRSFLCEATTRAQVGLFRLCPAPCL
jgi:hypothetical protein